MSISTSSQAWSITLLVVVLACARAGATESDAPQRSPVADARQMVLVTTPAWDSTSGTLRRFARTTRGGVWRAVGAPVPVVVGRTGLAWDAALAESRPGAPVKREGDGKSPAGAFPLDTAFGFSARETVSWIRLPYLPLRDATECVDDTGSVHYNTIVQRDRVGAVDWTSAEHMRRIDQYRIGVHVGYNATPPRRGGGSCIFLHVWSGSASTTAGCTAMEEGALTQVVRWLDPARRPMLVQLPLGELARVRHAWSLP